MSGRVRERGRLWHAQWQQEQVCELIGDREEPILSHFPRVSEPPLGVEEEEVVEEEEGVMASFS